MQTTENSAGEFIVFLPPTFNLEVRKDFRTAVQDVCTKSPKQLAVDFSHVEYIDSAGLGMLKIAREESEKQGFKLMLTNIRPGQVRQVLELVNFHKLFDVRYSQ